jgi:superfamily II DNA or RNA helicase
MEYTGWRANVYAPRPALTELVEELCIRRTYEDPDVQLELPDMIMPPPLLIEPSGKTVNLLKMAASEYRQFDPILLEEMPMTSAQQLVTSLRQISATDEAKASALVEELNDLPYDRPALVYCWFKSTCGFLMHKLKAAGIEVEIITGEDNPRDRRLRVEAAFKSGKHVIATIASLSEGINVSEYIDTCVFYEEDFSYGNVFQALSRLRRWTPGQGHRSKRIIFIELKGTVDEAIHKVWTRRERSALDVLNALQRIISGEDE